MKTEFALMVVTSFMGSKQETAIKFFDYYPNEHQIESELEAWSESSFVHLDYAYIQKRYVLEKG